MAREANSPSIVGLPSGEPATPVRPTPVVVLIWEATSFLFSRPIGANLVRLSKYFSLGALPDWFLFFRGFLTATSGLSTFGRGGFARVWLVEPNSPLVEAMGSWLGASPLWAAGEPRP